MRVIAYVRVSTEEQASGGHSLDAQRARIEAYATLYGLVIVGWTEDAASASSLRRAGLTEALKGLRAGRADGLLVAKLDRLTRSVSDLGNLIATYFSESSTHSLFSVGEQIDTRTAGGRLVLNVLTSVAQWERETIGERTRHALTHMRKKGLFTGGSTAYGYRREGRRIVEDDGEQTIIRHVIELHSEGLGCKRIAAQLADEGVTRRDGQPFSHVTIARIVARSTPRAA